MLDYADPMSCIRYRIAYGEAARLAEMARFDHSWGRDFAARVEKFVTDYKVGEDKGVPVVAPPPDADIYTLAQMWRWYPVLRLKPGVRYTLHLSSMDLNHGFNLYPVNLNFQIVPGYDYGLQIVPNKAGDFRVVCNEFCGIGHHLMVGKVVVE